MFVSTKILQKQSLMLKRKLSKYLTAESLVVCTCPTRDLDSTEGVILSFDPEKLVRVGRLYDLETRIQTKTANGVGDVGGEGSGEEIQTCQPGKEGAGCVGGEGSSGDTPGLSAHLGS
jgi:hypothetical protein